MLVSFNHLFVRKHSCEEFITLKLFLTFIQVTIQHTRCIVCTEENFYYLPEYLYEVYGSDNLILHTRGSSNFPNTNLKQSQ